jgi:hypothetical protein
MRVRSENAKPAGSRPVRGLQGGFRADRGCTDEPMRPMVSLDVGVVFLTLTDFCLCPRSSKTIGHIGRLVRASPFRFPPLIGLRCHCTLTIDALNCVCARIACPVLHEA